MAQSPTTSPNQVSEQQFLQNRLAFWSSFTGFVTWSAVAVAIILILLAIFLV